MGFYSLKALATPHTVELDFLFIEPAGIGMGYGKQLWQHAVDTARLAGFGTLLIEAEPQAEGFYKKMGAVWLATKPSPIADLFQPGCCPYYALIGKIRGNYSDSRNTKSG